MGGGGGGVSHFEIAQQPLLTALISHISIRLYYVITFSHTSTFVCTKLHKCITIYLQEACAHMRAHRDILFVTILQIC